MSPKSSIIYFKGSIPQRKNSKFNFLQLHKLLQIFFERSWNTAKERTLPSIFALLFFQVWLCNYKVDQWNSDNLFRKIVYQNSRCYFFCILLGFIFKEHWYSSIFFSFFIIFPPWIFASPEINLQNGESSENGYCEAVKT